MPGKYEKVRTMRYRVLLINPWIYDFAAFNLWARPLGLMRVAEHLSAFDAEMSLIDCTESFGPKQYGAGKFRSEIVEKPDALKKIPRYYRRYGIGADEFTGRLRSLMPVDFIMMTSVMSYWYPGVQKAIELVRAAAGDVPVILGGIYASLYHEHAAMRSGADFVYKGHVRESLNFALYTFGFKLKRKRAALPYHRLNLYKAWPFAPVLTSTGCPCRCSYCASALLAPGYEKRPADAVIEEIGELYDQGVRDYAFYDDALLMDSENHIKPILRSIAHNRPGIRFHTPNGLHAKGIDAELADLMKASNFKTLRLSLETINDARQKATGGKVSPGDMEKAVSLLKQRGFTKNEIGVYLMCGLPGQETGEVREGISFLKSLGVRIYLNEFSPIRRTKLWEELVQKGVIPDNMDPLLTNNTVFPYLYSGHDPEDISSMKLDIKRYNENDT